MIKKRLLLMIIVSTFIFLLTGCFNRPIGEIPPVGKRPTERFTIANYVQDDAIFQANSVLKIKGVAQPEVVIVATLYDNKNTIVQQSYCNTDGNSNWEVELNTPKASNKEYSLKIADSADIYHDTFANIRFGEVWLIIGDEFFNQTISDDLKIEEAIDYQKMFYYNDKWTYASSQISQMGYQLLNLIDNNSSSRNKKPLAIVFATADQTNIYSWLSREIIESRTMIKDFLEAESLYRSKDENLNPNDMAYLYEKYMVNLEGMSYENVLINQGLGDLIASNNQTCYQNNDFERVYTLMLYTFMSNLKDNFVINNKIFMLQATSSFDENISNLRLMQSNVCNFYNNCNIIPSYDLCNVWDEENQQLLLPEEINIDTNFDQLTIKGLDYRKLSARLYQFAYNNEDTPIISNVVKKYKNDEIATIDIVFGNVKKLNVKEIINGLHFYDLEGNEVEVPYQIEDNIISIDLRKTNDLELKEALDEPIEDKYLKLSEITYAIDNFIYNNNLGSNKIVAIPFVIKINNN